MAASPSPQQFCLRWNNHQSALVSVFDHLLQSEAFVDVTLAVDGLLLRAHKLVLSACSPYFQSMFASHPAKHPIIILKDVRYSDLRALLDFMYKGEVAVDQDRLPAFLRLAESLKIRGLAEFCEESLSNAAATVQSDMGAPSGAQPPIFDSLLDSQRRTPTQMPAPPTQGTNAAMVASGTAVELLPLSSQLAAVQKSAELAALDFSVPALAMYGGSPLALTTCSSSSIGSSSMGSKRPSSPQTYAHHRRKRGRPPRQSFIDVVGTSDSLGYKSGTTKDVRGSPEVMEMKVDILSMGVNIDSSQPTNSSNHDSSTAQDDDTKDKVASNSRNSSPPPPENATLSEATLSMDSSRPDVMEPQPGTSHQTIEHSEFDSRRGKGAKRARGRPRGYGRPLMNRSGMGNDLAGPSQDGSVPDRTLLMSGSNSNNTEQLQEMSIRGLNLFRYASVSEEGMYRCIPCEKEHVTRTFKNKYSFQRHAYLYHEGNQRKVFPCLVCGREFSRPDKLKHHLKTVHDYAVPREYSNAYYALP